MHLHHIEICVKNSKAMLDLFVKQLGFKLNATMENNICKQWVVSNKSATVLLSNADKISNTNSFKRSESFQEYDWGQSKFDYPNKGDSVFNIAFDIGDEDIAIITERAGRSGAKILQKPTSVLSQLGKVVYSTIETGFGNITHTFLDKRCYKGAFLPGYLETTNKESLPEKKTNLTNHIDHVTYACQVGQTDSILEFYREVFGMQRYLINKNDDPINGLVVGDNIGIRLKASKSLPSKISPYPFFLIVAEPLTSGLDNHIAKYLDQHGGTGIEHIAFHTDNMMESMENLIEKGVRFRNVPGNYYQKMNLNMNATEVNLLKKFGILYDEEEDCQSSGGSPQKKCLLQAFTTPIFDKETFFLEIIQRIGAVGLGTNNIVNLMKAIEVEQKSHHLPNDKNAISEQLKSKIQHIQ